MSIPCERYRADASVLAGLLLLHAGTAAALAPDEIYRRVAPTVWLVTTYGAQGKAESTGSAVAIADDILITNCHVLKGAESVSVRQGNTSHRATLRAADAERDLCQLHVAQLKLFAAEVMPEIPVIGQRVYAVGAPRGLEATLSDGLVSGIRRSATGGVEYIQTSTPISPGSSGGGLFDDNARLVGITTSGVAGTAQNLNFARPAGMLAAVPERAAVALQRWRDQQATTPAVPAGVAVAAPVPVPGSGPGPVVRAPVTVTVATPGPVAPTGPRPQDRQPARLASGYAPIDDLDAIPYLSDRGRAGYRDWLSRGTPRAFAVATNGSWAASWGWKSPNPEAPVDATERALWNCERMAKMPCKLYAVNNAVVWVK